MDEARQQAEQGLPPGAWLSSLTCIHLPHALAAVPHVLRDLQAAPQLEALLVRGFDLPPSQPLPTALQFICWAAQQPRLRQLTVALCHELRADRGADGEAAVAGGRGTGSCSTTQDGEREQAVRAALAHAAMEAQQRRPSLSIRIVSEDELLDPDSLFLEPMEQWDEV